VYNKTIRTTNEFVDIAPRYM